MNKTTLFKEVNKEIKKINNAIDSKIVKGSSYAKEAKRHRNLLATLRNIDQENAPVSVSRRSCLGKSPVRRRLNKGVTTRLFPWNFA